MSHFDNEIDPASHPLEKGAEFEATEGEELERDIEIEEPIHPEEIEEKVKEQREKVRKLISSKFTNKKGREKTSKSKEKGEKTNQHKITQQTPETLIKDLINENKHLINQNSELEARLFKAKTECKNEKEKLNQEISELKLKLYGKTSCE